MSILRRAARDLQPAPGTSPVFLDNRMAALGVTGVSVAAMRGGTMIDVEAFGQTRSGGPSVTHSTLFQAASVSKPVAALAVLRLVAAGQLDLDADVAGYLTSWQLPESAARRGAAVTLRRLLSHTAGLTVHGFPGYVHGAELPTLVQILEGAPPANTRPVIVDIEPGTAWRYSGGGYVAVQQVVEDVTGRSFAEVMNDLVLGPLSMDQSCFAQPLPPDRLRAVAQPHDASGTPLGEGAHVYPELAAAGLWTTATDLSRFAMGVVAALTGETGALLPFDLAWAMVTPGRGSHGLGPVVGGDAARPAFGHGGSNAGYRSWLWTSVDGIGLAVLTNGDGGEPIARELFRAVERL